MTDPNSVDAPLCHRLLHPLLSDPSLLPLYLHSAESRLISNVLSVNNAKSKRNSCVLSTMKTLKHLFVSIFQEFTTSYRSAPLPFSATIQALCYTTKRRRIIPDFEITYLMQTVPGHCWKRLMTVEPSISALYYSDLYFLHTAEAWSTKIQHSTLSTRFFLRFLFSEFVGTAK